jgi:uroporphyrin-III C-methyltransferase
MVNVKTIPELIVVGAGPGDPELITLKALNALKRAAVVMYDNLANRDLLGYAPESSEKIYVGKQPYGEYTPQEEIHRLIREKAMEKGCVVRLKGGDPFIFGRGMEEILFARELGIPASYIPGITAMQAIGLDDIPLTHRNISESVWFVTGTKKDGTLSHDLRLAMNSKATVVIYMGMKKLAAIAQVFIEEGKGELPAAIIQHASLSHRKKVIGQVKDLLQMAGEARLTHPALIVIGDVVGLGSIV